MAGSEICFFIVIPKISDKFQHTVLGKSAILVKADFTTVFPEIFLKNFQNITFAL